MPDAPSRFAVWCVTRDGVRSWVAVPVHPDGTAIGDTFDRPSLYCHASSEEEAVEMVLAANPSVKEVVHA